MIRYRPCVECPTLTTGSRCPAHQRPGTTARGYGTDHQHQRQALAETLPAPCYYCGQTLTPTDRWVAAHIIDGDPTSPRVPACPACNEHAKRR